MSDTPEIDTETSEPKNRTDTLGDVAPPSGETFGEGRPDDTDDTDDTEDEHRPVGTMAIMLAFLALIAVLWAYTYFELLRRG